MAQKPLTIRRWSRAEYDRLVGRGVFNGEPLELIGGQLVVAEPQGRHHDSAIGVVGAVLNAALPRGWAVGVHDYWIVNLIDRALEIYRDPVRASSAPYGWRYRSPERFIPQAVVAVVALLALPTVRIAVIHLLV